MLSGSLCRVRRLGFRVVDLNARSTPASGVAAFDMLAYAPGDSCRTLCRDRAVMAAMAECLQMFPLLRR